LKRFLSILLFLIPAISSAQLEGLVIVIDPGHGGYESDDRHLIPDPGIDFWESESNFYKALHLKALLEPYVDTVYLTRQGNANPDPSPGDDPTLTQRWQFANSVYADWFHSIHSNASGLSSNTTINRTIVLLKEDIETRQPEFPEAVTMSSNIYTQIRAHLRTQSSVGNIVEGVYLDYTFYGGTNGGFNLGVLSGLTMPGELSEGSFHDYFPETRRLMNNDYRKMEAYALTKAFLQYFGAPADTFGIIAGIQTNAETGGPMNGTVVRILPENRIYTGDTYNNGFYMFDSLATGLHTVIFDTPGFIEDTVEVTVGTGGVHFLDNVLSYSFATVLQTTPVDGDTSISVNAAVSVRFSYQMDTASVRQAFSISPVANATFTWTPDRKWLTATFDTLEYYTPYTIMIDSEAKGLNGYGVDLNGDEIGGDTLHLSFRTESALRAAAPVSFGQVKKGDTAAVMLVVRNRASYGIVLKNISNSTGEFWTTATLPDTIAASDSTSIEVFFSPATFGSFSDAMVLASDSGTIIAAATGSSPASSLLISHSFMGFGTVTTDTSKVRPMYLSSPSVNGVQIDSIYTKTAAFQFSPPQSFPFGLELGDTVFLSITFAPQGVGIASDTLFIVNSSAVNPVKVSLSGNGVINSVEKLPGTVDHFALFQNYPNPFNPVTAISYQIPAKAGTAVSYVRLSVVDMLGREVAVLVNEEQEAGRYSVTWEASSVPSGVYFYTLTTPHYRASRKMVLVK